MTAGWDMWAVNYRGKFERSQLVDRSQSARLSARLLCNSSRLSALIRCFPPEGTITDPLIHKSLLSYSALLSREFPSLFIRHDGDVSKLAVLILEIGQNTIVTLSVPVHLLVLGAHHALSALPSLKWVQLPQLVTKRWRFLVLCAVFKNWYFVASNPFALHHFSNFCWLRKPFLIFHLDGQ